MLNLKSIRAVDILIFVFFRLATSLDLSTAQFPFILEVNDYDKK